MCTSFMFRGNDTLLGMNYDQQGMNFTLEPYRPDRFLVTMKSWGRKRALFGVRSDGFFANQQVVNPCDGGSFRIGPRIVHTSQLIGNVLNGKIPSEQVGKYLDRHTVVNPPKISLHSLIADVRADGWIVEPGRGNVRYGKDTPFFVMGNCPVGQGEDFDQWEGFGVDRHRKVHGLLEKADSDFSVQDAFQVLQSVQQTEGDWITEFSLVYSTRENKVYYCFNHNYNAILEYQMRN